MASYVFRGCNGAVKFGPRGAGVAQPLSSWTMQIQVPEIDQSDYDSFTTKTAAGLPSASITASGPYPQTILNLKPADLATMTLWIDQSNDVGFTFRVLITGLTLSSDTRGVVQFNLTATAQEDFYSGAANTSEVIL